MMDSFPAFVPFPAAAVKSFLRPGLQVFREFPVHLERLRQAGPAPLAVFLPAYGPTGAALLRIYHVARDVRRLGWRSVVLPPTLSLRQRRRLLAQLAPDVVVMQGVRHALNRPVLYQGAPIVLDMDDADFHLPHLKDVVRRAMEDVTCVIAGSRYVADWCRGQGASADVVWTGAPVSEAARVPAAARPAVVAWAQTRPMTYVREAALVAEVMRDLARQHPGVTLRLYDRQAGDDPAFLDMFRSDGLHVEWCPKMAYRDFLASLDDVAIGLAPLSPETPFSRGKSFGKVLAYLDRGVPVIGSEACEHPAFFTPETGVITNAAEFWVAAIGRLLTAPAARQSMADAGFEAFRSRLSVSAASERVSAVLFRVITSGAGSNISHNLAYRPCR